MTPATESEHNKAVLKERTWARTIMLVGVTLAAASFFFWLSHEFGEWHWFIRQAICRELGAACVATGGVAFLWETFAKRALLEELKPEFAELIGQVRLAQDIRTASLVQVTVDFQNGIDWASFFTRVQELDVFFAYARSWMASNRTHLEKLAKRKGARVRFVYPDPENAEILASLAYRFKEDAAHVKKLILDSEEEVKKVFASSECEFSIWHSPFIPVYSFYRFDHTLILALYKHRPIRGGDLPAFVVEQGGTIYSFMENEMKVIFDDGQIGAKKVFPPPSAAG